MGGGQSVTHSYLGIYNTQPSLQEFKNDFTALGLRNSDVKSLHDTYLKIDNSKKNSVEIDAIFLTIGIHNEFLKKLFIYTINMKLKQSCDRTTMESEVGNTCSVSIDSQDLYTVSFDIFVYTMWSICSLQPSFFELLVFDVYMGGPDKEHMTSVQVQEMLVDIYGPEGGGNFHAIRALSILKDNDNIDDYYDIDDFYDFTYQNSVVQFSLFILQTKLHAAIGGFKFWESIGDRRYRKFYGYSSIAEILRWGEYAEKSNSTPSSAVPRKFSAVALTSQRMVMEAYRLGADEDSICGGQQQDQLPENSHLKNMSISGFNASFAAHSALQHRRNSKPYVKSSVDARRRSFDVTIIIKETSFSSCRAEDSIMDRRRHSVIA